MIYLTISISMALRFNYDNDRMLIGNWLPGGGGEFMLRCLSMSKHMVLFGDTIEIRSQIANPGDYDLKLAVFSGQGKKTSEDKKWHKHFRTSNQWFAALGKINDDTKIEGQFTETLFSDAHLASREFYDQFWRPVACEVSNAGLGFGIKTHLLREMKGLMHILPMAKVAIGESSSNWQKKNENKIDMVYARLYDPLLQDIPSDINGARLHIDDMMSSDSLFLQQMESAYRSLKLDDYKQCRDHLREMRKIYLSWHLNIDL